MKRLTAILIFSCLLLTALHSVPRDKVIVEIATGTWCQYCPGAAMGADDLVNNGYDVAIIENHGGDTFATTASNARNDYYSASGFPTAWFDGGNAAVGGSHTVSQYNNYLPRVNARLAIPSHFTIEAAGQEVNGVYSATVILNKTETDTNTNLVLQAVLTESDILYSWQGQTQLDFVSRLMLPDYNGTSVNFGTGSTLSIPLSFTLNPAWVPVNCELVLFLQNNTTKEILQGTSYTLGNLLGENPASIVEINFPTTYVTTSQTASLTLNNPLNSVMSGTITSDNPAFTIAPAGRLDYSIPPYDSLTFDITYTATSTNSVTGNITITTNLPLFPSITIPVTGTAVYAPPKSPDNVQIVMNGLSAYTSWDAVTETIINTPVLPDYYLFYCNSSGDINGNFTYLGRTRTLHYNQNNAAFSAIPRFYRVVAQRNYAREGSDPTDLLKPGMTETEVNSILSRQSAR
jgi:hypothetical protein